MVAKQKIYNWIAYSPEAGTEEFETREDAEKWLLETEEDEYSEAAMTGACWIAQIVARTEFEETARREDDPENWSGPYDVMGYLYLKQVTP